MTEMMELASMDSGTASVNIWDTVDGCKEKYEYGEE